MRPSVFVAMVVLAASLFSFAPSALADDAKNSYYMMVFGSDGPGRQARMAHTFATFVHVRQVGGGKPKIEAHTISWLPQSLRIVVLRRTPEPGVNLDLPKTLAWARELGATVSVWGPYQIQGELYERAITQETRLNSGKVLYKAVDDRYRPEQASNCIHAVSDIDLENGGLHLGQQWGQEASQAVAKHLSRWIIGPETVYPALFAELNVKDYPFQVRPLP